MKPSWYVVYTKPREEIRAEVNLDNQGYEVYLPRVLRHRRRRGNVIDVVEPLFPRYMFVRLTIGCDNLMSLRSTRGVSSLVSFGNTPASVPDKFVLVLRRSEDPGKGYFECEDKAFDKGTTVSVVDGPFAGIQAKVHSDMGGEDVTLLVSLFGRVNKITVPRYDVISA